MLFLWLEERTEVDLILEGEFGLVPIKSIEEDKRGVGGGEMTIIMSPNII